MRALHQIDLRRERWLVSAAFICVLGSVGWSVWPREATTGLGELSPTGEDYEEYQWPAGEGDEGEWNDAHAGAGSRGGAYSLFASPSKNMWRLPQTEVDFGAGHIATSVTETEVELLEVRKRAFRLQLVGCLGGPGHYVGAFASRESAEIFVARSGRRFPELGLELRTLEIRLVAPWENPEATIREPAGVAVLWDERAGSEVVLDSRRRVHTEVKVAVLWVRGAARAVEVAEGETVTVGGVAYTVAQIRSEPCEVVLEARESMQRRPTSLTLRVANRAAEPQTVSPGKSSSRVQRQLP